ncbi:hypothetical protein [Amycolatopsis sp. NPDC051061]|uniref:hypothetical protein n=1 Tax=Amycolatopsis sp. NPDC051061 TaxID=3155042 RepID=UPI00341B68E6
MIDPLADIPVAVPADYERVTALALDRLPTTSPLLEVILEGPVWIQTEDGRLYPASHDTSAGLIWGYSGAGPIMLAILVAALLDDINHKGVTPSGDAPSELIALFEKKWSPGTVFPREYIENVRGL